MTRLLLTLVLLCLAMPAAAQTAQPIARTQPIARPATTPIKPALSSDLNTPETQAQFAMRKSATLDKLARRVAQAQQKYKCAQAANDTAALKACNDSSKRIRAPRSRP